MTRTAFRLAAALVAALIATEASAATMQAVYTGIVYNSYDSANMFGAGVGSLDGLDFTQTFVYDAAAAQRTDDGQGGNYLQGGPDFGYPPILSASMTINGVTHLVPSGGNWDAYFYLEGQKVFQAGHEIVVNSNDGGASTRDNIWVYINPPRLF
jgi:hypothetical protein